MAEEQTDRSGGTHGAGKPLELSTVLQLKEAQEGVMVDGEWHPYANTQAWGLAQSAEWRGVITRIFELEEVRRPTKAQAAEYEHLTADACRIIAPSLPPEKVLALSLQGRTALVLDFLVGLSESRAPMAGPMDRLAALLQRRIGASSSQGSNGSTGEAPETG